MAELTNVDDLLTAEKTSTLKETDRKCPACGGTMDFDPATGGLHCPFCDYTGTDRKLRLGRCAEDRYL